MKNDLVSVNLQFLDNSIMVNFIQYFLNIVTRKICLNFTIISEAEVEFSKLTKIRGKFA